MKLTLPDKLMQEIDDCALCLTNINTSLFVYVIIF